MRALSQSVFVLGLAALSAVPALAQPQPEELLLPPGGAIPVFPPVDIVAGLLPYKSVQEELKLTAEQVKDIAAATSKVRDKYKDDLTKRGTLGPNRWNELLAKMDDETRKAVAQILRPEQAKRLKQIELQLQGLYAFLNEEVVKDLKLTDDQKDKIKGVFTEYFKDCAAPAKEMSKEPSIFSTDIKVLDAQMKAALQKVTKAAMDIDGVLTDDQRKAWKELIGAPFEFKP